MQNKEKPLISVIVPVYNGEKYLDKCINSILEQDYKNLEVILINDGSKDKSNEIIKYYAKLDKRIVDIDKENEGVCASRNIGLDISKGEYICLIDQDDYIEKDYISYLYNLIIENNSEVSLTPTARKFTENKIKNQQNNSFSDYVEVWTGEKAANEMLCYNLIIAPWNKMIRKNIVTENNIKFDTRYYGGEGFLFSIECFVNAKNVAVGHKLIYNYRCDNPNSGMTKFSMKVIKSSIDSQKTIKEKALRNNPKLNKACRYSNWHTYCDCLNFFIGCKVIKKYKEEYKKIKKVCKKDALCVFDVKIPIKERCKGILYFISPYMASKLINHFRLRRFTID